MSLLLHARVTSGLGQRHHGPSVAFFNFYFTFVWIDPYHHLTRLACQHPFQRDQHDYYTGKFP